MADNFTKAEAIVAKAANGTDSIRLQDRHINELLNLNGAGYDPLLAYGTAIPAAIPLITGQGASVTYFINVLAPEITGSAVYDDSGNIAKAQPVTIYANAHTGYQEELTKAEVTDQGLGSWLATKASNYTTQALKKKTREGFKTLIADSEDMTITAQGTSETERDYATRVIKELVLAAGQMARTSDLNQGIDTYDTSQITITVSNKMMATVIAAGLQGNMTTETFASGVVNKTTWGNIAVQSSQFLPAGTDAFIGTSFLGKSPFIPVHLYAGPKTAVGLKYKAAGAFLLPGIDADKTTGFEIMYKDVIGTAGTIDYDADFVTKLNVTLA